MIVSASNLSLVVIILGPIAWRKYATWRMQKARSSQTSTDSIKQPFLSFPSPLILPSNLLLSLAFICLGYVHLSYLFHPSKILSRSDMFLLTNTPVSAPLLQIRSRVASMSFEELGWDTQWGDEGLETLLRRLSSFEGRKLHLMIGSSPFLSCLYCSTPKDYLIFSISDLLWQFSTNLILFGVLTLRFDSLEVLDEIIFSTIQLTTRLDMRRKTSASNQVAGSNSVTVRPDGFGYRLPLLYLIGCFALAQATVYFGLWDMTFGQGRWDHWHANFNVTFHCALLIAATWIYFGQRIPKVPAMIEIAHLIRRSRQYNDETLAHVQATHLTNQIMWGDAGLRDRASKWHDARSETLEELTCDETIDRLSARAGQVLDTSKLRQASRLAAKTIWLLSQGSVQEWEKIVSQPKSTPSDSSTPLASSLSQ